MPSITRYFRFMQHHMYHLTTRNSVMEQELSFKGNDPGAVQYGNFINYYQFHPPEARINSLPTNIWKVLNDTKSCIGLDVGCNCGDLTLGLQSFLAKNSTCACVSVLGIDIDPTLVVRANEKKNVNVSFECIDIMSKEANYQLKNYLKKFEKEKFDVIFCFSVTMWIHLNFGDEGLVRFLQFICKIGHFLVIEPQPWKCYGKAVRRMKKSSENFPLYSTLKIRSNVDKEIENIVLQTKLFSKIHETTSCEWSRKVLFFELIR